MSNGYVDAFPGDRIIKDRSIAGFTEEVERNKSEFVRFLGGANFFLRTGLLPNFKALRIIIRSS